MSINNNEAIEKLKISQITKDQIENKYKHETLSLNSQENNIDTSNKDQNIDNESRTKKWRRWIYWNEQKPRNESKWKSGFWNW